MCSPALLAMGVQGAGGIYSATQANAAGKANKAYYDALSVQANQEADIATQIGERRSTIAQDQGAIDSKIAMREADKTAADQRVALAANGAGGGVTAQDIISDAYDKRTLDQMAIRYNADSKSYEAKTDAAYKSWDAKNRARGYTAAGINEAKAGKVNALSTLFSTATQLLDTNMRFKQYGNTNLARIQ